MKPTPLFEIASDIDVAGLAATFQRDGRVQVPNVLTPETAATLHRILSTETEWGLGWGAAEQTGNVRAAAWHAMSPAERAKFGDQARAAAQRGDFAFLYARYPMIEAYLEQWDPGHPLDLLLEHLNAPLALDFLRDLTGILELIKAEAQATLFAPGHFLTSHDDHHAATGRRVAYVLNLARDWQPDWGAYLSFHNAAGDIKASFRPAFNSLNLFAVPQRHSVGFVPPYAPVGRYAITGWYRDQ